MLMAWCHRQKNIGFLLPAQACGERLDISLLRENCRMFAGRQAWVLQTASMQDYPKSATTPQVAFRNDFPLCAISCTFVG
jgi:hypothetical protein